MSIVGIGGFFFRSENPEVLSEWYKTHIGIVYEDYKPWVQEKGPTVFVPFPKDSNYFPADKQYMLNFRVGDLDAVLEKLKAANIEIISDPSWNTPETGKFARIHDPEGNPIELWEPPKE